MKIRLRILSLILIVVLATGGVAILVGRTISMNTVENEISDHLLTTAQSRTHHIETMIHGHMQELQLVNNAAEMYLTLVLSGFAGMDRSSASPLTRSLLEGVASSSPRVREAIYIHKDGTVEYSSTESRVAQDLHTTEVFLTAKDAPYFRESIGELTGDLTLVAAAPVYVAGDLDGVIAVIYEMDDLNDITDDFTGMGDTGEVYIVNEDGYMITASRFWDTPKSAILNQQVDLSGISSLLSADVGETETGDADWKVVSADNYLESDVLGVYYTIPEVGWTVVVEKGASEAFARVDALTRWMIWALLGVLALGTVLAVFISRAISGPILKLHRGAEEIMNGNWDFQFSTTAKDEIGALSRAFERMTSNLKKSHEELKGYSERLEAKVDERTSELATANEVLNKEIQERRQAEEALRHSEEYFRALTENATDVVIVLHADGTIRYRSPSAQRVTGFTPDDVLGRNAFEMIHPDDLAGASKVFREGFGQPGYTASMSLRILNKEGDYRFIEITGKNLLDDPAVEGVVINYRDITERKSAEEALQQAYDELELHVEQRTAELARANEFLLDEITERQKAEQQLRTSLREKDVLLKEIHHRVKNNLQVISSLLNLQTGSIEDDETIAMLRDSQNRVKSMALVHEKLYQSEDLSRVDFGEYIRNLANHLFRTYKAGTNGIALKVEAEDVSLGIDAAIPCGLIVNELITNALKYAFPERSRRDSRSSPAEIRVGFCQNGENSFTMTVSDNGVGLPEGFDVETAESLGLQLVYTLTGQLGGTVEYRSSGGAEFGITFSEITSEDEIRHREEVRSTGGET